MSTFRHWEGPPDAAEENKTLCTGMSCFAPFFNFLNAKSVDLLWDAELGTRADAMADQDGGRSKFSCEVVSQHVKLLRQCGFKFTFSQELIKVFSHRNATYGMTPAQIKAVTAPPEGVPGYRFSVYAGDNSPIMAKFFCNSVRWIHNYHSCLVAFHKMVEEVAPKPGVETFNLLVIAAQTEFRSSSHNLGLGYGRIVPFKKAEYEALKTRKMAGQTMSTTVQLVSTIGKSIDESTDLPWLAKPGGYERYMKELEPILKSQSGGKKALMREALGI